MSRDNTVNDYQFGIIKLPGFVRAALEAAAESGLGQDGGDRRAEGVIAAVLCEWAEGRDASADALQAALAELAALNATCIEVGSSSPLLGNAIAMQAARAVLLAALPETHPIGGQDPAMPGMGYEFANALARFIVQNNRDTQASLSPARVHTGAEPMRASLASLAEKVARGRAKFPGRRFMLAALMEEAGELARALLQRKGQDEVRAEALDVAVVALRIYEEGDATFDDITEDEALP